MNSPYVDPQKEARRDDLEAQIGQCAAQAHAAMARVAEAFAEYDGLEFCDGFRSSRHWLTVNAGFDLSTSADLLRVGSALTQLPLIAAAFKDGRLSFDKVRQVTTVATPATDEMLLQIALGASGSQLERICCSLRRIARADAAGHDQKQLEERGLWSRIDDDGMMRLIARLPSEDGAVVMAAIEALTGSKPLPQQTEGEVQDPAAEPWAARRADALVSICERALADGAADVHNAGATRQVVVHVDAGLLTGETQDGRCYVENGAPLSVDVARRIGCDAEIIAVTERNGSPVDVGRKRRFPPDRLRRALEVRDRFCRFPGCAVPAHRAQSHHCEHWADGGATTLDNLMLLCGFHHRRYHDGGYTIRKKDGRFCFETHDGHVIGSTLPRPLDPPQFPPEAPRAEWGGAQMDFDHAVWVIAHAQARAAPS